MNDTVLLLKPAARDTFAVPKEEVLPLRWSIPVWLMLAGASWAALYGVISLVL